MKVKQYAEYFLLCRQ